MLPKAGITAGPNWLTFFEGTLGGKKAKKSFNFFFTGNAGLLC